MLTVTALGAETTVNSSLICFHQIIGVRLRRRHVFLRDTISVSLHEMTWKSWIRDDILSRADASEKVKLNSDKMHI